MTDMSPMPADDSILTLAQLAAREASARAEERRRQRTISGQEAWYIMRRGWGFVEQRLDEISQKNGFSHYLPKMRRMVAVPKRNITIGRRNKGIPLKEPKLVPLLPSYLFVKFDRRRQDWRDLFVEARIRGMIFSEEAGETIPVSIRVEEIEKMKSLEVDGAIPEETPVRKLAFAKGEEIRVIASAYAGFPAVVAALPEKLIGDLDEEIIFRVYIKMFGRTNLVELPLSAISKL